MTSKLILLLVAPAIGFVLAMTAMSHDIKSDRESLAFIGQASLLPVGQRASTNNVIDLSGQQMPLRILLDLYEQSAGVVLVLTSNTNVRVTVPKAQRYSFAEYREMLSGICVTLKASIAATGLDHYELAVGRPDYFTRAEQLPKIKESGIRPERQTNAPNNGLLRTGAPRTVRQSAEP